jgi:LysR family glycine cleavage system transcriptional activator
MRPENVKAGPALPAPRRSELPPLDLLRSFESAARHLSFTRAAHELFLTQSAVSRQIQQVEASLGVALFHRHHRALELTEAGRVLQRAVVDCLERLRDVTSRLRSTAALRQVSMTCTPSFASLWLIPRLERFTASHPAVDVRMSATMELLDLERSQVDLAIRFCPIAQGQGPLLFEESEVPVCAPRLVTGRPHPLKKPADLVHHTLLAVDMHVAVDWEPWIRVMGLAEMRMKNTLRFTQYPDAIAAAVAGQGVAIGRLPLLAQLLQDRQLVAPFGSSVASQRGYYVMTSARGASNPDAQDFVAWLRAEAEMARDGAEAGLVT